MDRLGGSGGDLFAMKSGFLSLSLSLFLFLFLCRCIRKVPRRSGLMLWMAWIDGLVVKEGFCHENNQLPTDRFGLVV